MARKIDALLAGYGESHQNPTNKLVHWVCVSVIFWISVALLCILLITLYTSYTTPWPLWQFAIALFVLAWAGQFWGHKVEGKKPSFLKDVQFLLIGPAWLISFVYRRLGVAY